MFFPYQVSGDLALLLHQYGSLATSDIVDKIIRRRAIVKMRIAVINDLVALNRPFLNDISVFGFAGVNVGGVRHTVFEERNEVSHISLVNNSENHVERFHVAFYVSERVILVIVFQICFFRTELFGAPNSARKLLCSVEHTNVKPCM